MRRHLALLLALALVVGALGAPALAGKKKKKKKKPQPVETVMYFHGEEQIGETEMPETWLDSLWRVMDENEPEGTSTKSHFVTNYVRGPNTNCSGNGLLPLWRGDMTGTIKGDVTVTVHTMATPATQVEARLYPDANGGCNEEAQEPAATVIADVPAGEGEAEIVFEDVDIDVVASLVVQFNAPELVNQAPAGAFAHPGQVRLFYDSTDAPSKIEFMCLPQKRAKACAN